jgi:hypothetical protein
MVLASVRASEFGRFGFVCAFLGFAMVLLLSFLSLTRPYHSSFPPFLRLGQRTFVVQCAKAFTYPPTDPSETSGQNMCHIRYLQIWFRHPYVGLLVMAEPLMRGGWDSPRDPGVL